MTYKHPRNHVVYRLLRDDPFRKHLHETRACFGVLKPSVAEKLRAALLLMGAKEGKTGLPPTRIEVTGYTEDEYQEWLICYSNDLKRMLPEHRAARCRYKSGWLCDSQAVRSFVRKKLADQDS